MRAIKKDRRMRATKKGGRSARSWVLRMGAWGRSQLVMAQTFLARVCCSLR